MKRILLAIALTAFVAGLQVQAGECTKSKDKDAKSGCTKSSCGDKSAPKGECPAKGADQTKK